MQHGDTAAWRSKSFPSMLADEMQIQSNQPCLYNHSPITKCQSPLHIIMCLMRNHSQGEWPNLCKHTVRIDLLGWDMSLLGASRASSFSASIKRDNGGGGGGLGEAAVVVVQKKRGEGIEGNERAGGGGEQVRVHLKKPQSHD